MYRPLIVVSMVLLALLKAQAQDTVTINFTGMTPHVGQLLSFRVVDVSDNSEVGRNSIIVTVPDFELSVGGIQLDSSYNLDFWADLNGDGGYDSPSTDHAWRITLDSVKGDTTVDFAHNTTFTDVGWVNRITLALTNMTPHLGQNLYFALRYKNSGAEVERQTLTEDTAAFDVFFDNVVVDSSYLIDFFADHNNNGSYDPPGTDHAWRITLDSINGDTLVPFVHNTDFTDIEWVDEGDDVNSITLALSDMDPHMGQNLYFALRLKGSGAEVERQMLTEGSPAFDVVFDSVIVDSSYLIDFYADHNMNGSYDAPPEDHAWRLTLDSIKGDTVVPFVHNTEFTDIEWVDEGGEDFNITLSLSNMDPHMGQNLYFALKYKSGWEIDRQMVTEDSPAFDVVFEGAKLDSSYMIDFFADHNMNGRYDAPDVDHAWRITLDSIQGDTVVPFVHNTEFTDIEWMYKLTVEFTGMTPHLDQVLKLYLRNQNDSSFADTVTVDPVMQADFSVSLFTIVPDSSYNIDFYVDFNENGTYDVPPVDHAWRIPLVDVQGDTTVAFAHNTDFTDIGLGGVINSVDDLDANSFSTYPNPVKDELIIKSNRADGKITGIRIYSATGSLVLQRTDIDSNTFRVNVSSLKPGMYILNIGDEKNSKRLKIVKE